VLEVLDVKQTVTGVRLKTLKTNEDAVLPVPAFLSAIAIGRIQTRSRLHQEPMKRFIVAAGMHHDATSPACFVAAIVPTMSIRQASRRGRGCSAAIDAERYLAAENQ